MEIKDGPKRSGRGECSAPKVLTQGAAQAGMIPAPEC